MRGSGVAEMARDPDEGQAEAGPDRGNRRAEVWKHRARTAGGAVAIRAVECVDNDGPRLRLVVGARCRARGHILGAHVKQIRLEWLECACWNGRAVGAGDGDVAGAVA